VIAKYEQQPAFEIAEVPTPDIGPNDVLVRLAATGICGTDVMLASGKLGQTRRILGHEGIGRVVRVGSSVKDLVQCGQRVGVSWVRDTCGDCVPCRYEGGECRCLQKICSGLKVDGTFAEYTIVPYRYLVRLPEGPADKDLAPIMCAGVTAYKALKISDAIPGQWVAILGAGGGVGAMAIQYGQAMGYRVLAIDVGKEKGEYCMSLQAEAYIDVEREKDLSTAAKHATSGLGASAVLVVAGSVQAYQGAFGFVAPFGTVVCIGIPALVDKMQLHPLTFIDNGIRLIGTVVGTRADILEAVEFVRRGTVVPRVEIVSLADITKVTKLCASGKATTKYVVLFAENTV